MRYESEEARRRRQEGGRRREGARWRRQDAGEGREGGRGSGAIATLLYANKHPTTRGLGIFSKKQ